ncbi:MAG: hypothetical protein M9916_08975 [Crocinitomicaceae bacterium]|nr:hypothetical protein [Crocinitomicaceae bacterium]
MRTIHKIILVGFSAVLLGGCSSSTTNQVENSEQSVSEKIAVIPNKMLSVEIEGMTCEMGCGSEIRKELTATGAVERVKFDFKMGRDVNTAFISFDDSKISKQKIEEIIATMNKKQFTVGSASVEDYKADNSTKSANASSTTSKVQVDFPDIEPTEAFTINIPNFIDLLLGVLIRK